MSERVIYKHVAVIGIDGMGNFNKVARTPLMDKIFMNGATTYNALSMDPTISAENWGAMLLGAEPMVHGLTNSIVGHYEYTNKDLPSAFTRIRKAMPDAYLASVCNWNPINYGIIEHDIDVDMSTAQNDELLTPIIEEKIAKKPVFLFVQFDDVDGAGHGNWYGTDGHIKQIETTDSYVNRLYKAYEKAGIIDDTLFVVIADHGGYRGGHGGYHDTEKFVFLGVAGKGVSNGKIPFALTKDISSIVLYALGLEYPEYDIKAYSSQVPEGIFPWYKEKYIKEKAKTNLPKTKETPEFDSEKGLSKFVDKDKLKLAVYFDDSIKDETGNCALTEKGTIKYYSTGIYGARGELGSTGHVRGSGLNLSDEGFTVASYIMVDPSLMEDANIISCKPWWWQDRSEKGFALVLRCGDTEISLSDGKDDFSFVTPLHNLVSKGWIHALYTVDLVKKKVRVYYDFKFIREKDIPAEINATSIKGDFVIGNDITETYNNEKYPLTMNVDDLLVFDGVLTEEEIAKLEEYYA